MREKGVRGGRVKVRQSGFVCVCVRGEKTRQKMISCASTLCIDDVLSLRSEVKKIVLDPFDHSAFRTNKAE